VTQTFAPSVVMKPGKGIRARCASSPSPTLLQRAGPIAPASLVVVGAPAPRQRDPRAREQRDATAPVDEAQATVTAIEDQPAAAIANGVRRGIQRGVVRLPRPGLLPASPGPGQDADATASGQQDALRAAVTKTTRAAVGRTIHRRAQVRAAPPRQHGCSAVLDAQNAVVERVGYHQQAVACVGDPVRDRETHL
jgi:hypothetical protein